MGLQKALQNNIKILNRLNKDELEPMNQVLSISREAEIDWDAKESGHDIVHVTMKFQISVSRKRLNELEDRSVEDWEFSNINERTKK